MRSVGCIGVTKVLCLFIVLYKYTHMNTHSVMTVVLCTSTFLSRPSDPHHQEIDCETETGCEPVPPACLFSAAAAVTASAAAEEAGRSRVWRHGEDVSHYDDTELQQGKAGGHIPS